MKLARAAAAVWLLSIAAGWAAEPAIPADQASFYRELLRKEEADPLRYAGLWRPQYHFTPPFGYMNDPNGLVYFNGEWHLCYQYSRLPDALNTGTYWGHATSEDLVHWKLLGPVIAPDALGSVFSGSTVLDARNQSGLFPGGQPGLVSFFTYHLKGAGQSQAMAYSPDGQSWFKYPGNPVIPALPNEPSFRDPKVFWYAPGNKWVLVVGAARLHIYSSTNLREWREESAAPIPTECPDLFELPVDGGPQKKWVLSRAGAAYQIGSFDGKAFTAETDALPLSHRSALYASQSWSGAPDGRRVFISWLSRFDQPRVGTPWAGAQSLPVDLSLRKLPEGICLFETPAPELEDLRGEKREWENLAIDPAAPKILPSGIERELELVLEPGAAKRCGLILRKGPSEETRVTYDAEKHLLLLDRSRAGRLGMADEKPVVEAPLDPVDGKIRLRVYLDDSIVEVFANDGYRHVAGWVFPSPSSDGCALFAEGGKARCVSLVDYTMGSIWRDEDALLPPHLLTGRSYYKVAIGQRQAVGAQVFPRSIDTAPIEWKSSNPAIVAVQAADARNATAIALAPGQAVLTASLPGKKLSGTVTIAAYEKSFRTNAGPWEPEKDEDWIEVPGGMQGAANGRRAYLNAKGLRRGVLEASLTLAPDSRAGLTVRDNGRHKFCYTLSFDQASGQARLFRTADFRQEDLGTAPFPAASPLAVAVRLQNGRALFEAGGQRLFDVEDNTADIPDGARNVSLVVEKGNAVFQDVKAAPEK
ncbi:MAG: GH32 C-terminal domain-containing protein [Verrucomicrobium sp.]|nr:GH32 C-terminal domain-containing protein [Verrucomicrobium sp.]